MTLDLSTRTVLITGGTGSFGSTLARRLLEGEVGQVRIFSRDETKQDHMRHSLADPRLRFYLGDVRDYTSLASAMPGTDYVFHAAALKQVPSCEFFPLEAVRTNVLGSSNVIDAAHAARVRSVVCLSTDKAVYPVNAMGMSKGLMEKVVQAFARNNPQSETTVCLVRYGNVIYSRGSVIPLFVQQIRSGQAITVTDPNMTRFMMSMSDAIDLVEHAFVYGSSGDLFIRKSPASSLQTLILALGNLLGVEPAITVIGVRHGEKLYETLATREELSRSINDQAFFRIPLDARSLDYDIYFDKGETDVRQLSDYDSTTTQQLSQPELERLFLSIPEIRAEVLDESGPYDSSPETAVTT